MSTLKIKGEKPNTEFTKFFLKYIPFEHTIYMDLSGLSQEQVSIILSEVKRNYEDVGCKNVSVSHSNNP